MPFPPTLPPISHLFVHCLNQRVAIMPIGRRSRLLELIDNVPSRFVSPSWYSVAQAVLFFYCVNLYGNHCFYSLDQDANVANLTGYRHLNEVHLISKVFSRIPSPSNLTKMFRWNLAPPDFRHYNASNIPNSREIDTPGRHELILLGEGEKKVSMTIETRK